MNLTEQQKQCVARKQWQHLGAMLGISPQDAQEKFEKTRFPDPVVVTPSYRRWTESAKRDMAEMRLNVSELARRVNIHPNVLRSSLECNHIASDEFRKMVDEKLRLMRSRVAKPLTVAARDLHDELIKEYHAKGMTMADMSRLLPLSPTAVRHRVVKLGLKT